ncbi:HAD-superfamily hydrolase, subfamily IIB [Clostridium sp. ASBs410]|jgi:Cof subfamily protein (haloacid dehalogenase superfamily)|nr:HAD-superfamily hydrolase, subfamily IIB [Clostridium sp. ASBs410]
MSDIKVIIMDVDGTLFNSKKMITAKTKETLLKAQSAGAKLILASGRPTAGLFQIGKELEMDQHHGLFVAYNGSKVIDFETMETLFNEPLGISDGKAVLEHLKKFDVYPMIDKDNYMYVNNVYADPIQWKGRSINIIEYEARGGGYLLCEKEDLSEFLDYEVNKILTAGDPSYLQEHYKDMMDPFKEKLNCMFTADFYFEYTAKGIDKAKALDTVLKPMGFLPAQMIGFGDGMNDISMIQYTGIGVAMENAVQELKNTAQYVTASNDEDGIAEALYKYMPQVVF